MDKNYGLDLEQEEKDRDEKDWEFGALGDVKGLAEDIPADQRALYSPVGEVQRGREDFMDCASRGPHNILERKLNYLYKNNIMSLSNKQWLEKNGYVNPDGKIELSDPFTAILSGTRPTGNSMKAPLESIRKNGCIPKKILPGEQWMKWSDYHKKDRITDQMLDLGKEFARRFPVNYLRVNRKDFDKLLDDQSIDAAGFAWPELINGEYQRTEARATHVFEVFLKRYFAFDNYEVGGDFVKKLAANYKFYKYGYKVIINENVVDAPIFSNGDLMKTLKFETDPRIFVVSGKNPQKLFWIGDDDAWIDYKMLLEEGLVEAYKTVDDSLMSTYKISGSLISVSQYGSKNKGLLQRLKNLFKIYE